MRMVFRDSFLFMPSLWITLHIDVDGALHKLISFKTKLQLSDADQTLRLCIYFLNINFPLTSCFIQREQQKNCVSC
jgi:hypothetical protein